jgi:hypothetical protein
VTNASKAAREVRANDNFFDMFCIVSLNSFSALVEEHVSGRSEQLLGISYGRDVTVIEIVPLVIVPILRESRVVATS